MESKDTKISTILGIHRQLAVKTKSVPNGLQMLQICRELMELDPALLHELYCDCKSALVNSLRLKSKYEIRIDSHYE